MDNSILSFKSLSISTKTIYKASNYKKSTVPQEYLEAIEEELLFAEKNFEAKFEYILFSEFVLDKKLAIKNKIFNIGQELINLLEHSEQIALFICTAGNKIERRNKQLIDQDRILSAYANDVIGNTIVEKTADVILPFLKDKYHTKTTNRYSPGNCGWEDMNQIDFFSLFRQSTAGVRLNDFQMMTPIKSLNGIIGLGENVKFKYSNCFYCDSEGCIYRNKAFITKS